MQTKLSDAKQSTEGSSSNNNNNDNINKSNSNNEEDEDEAAFHLSPGLEKFFSKPAMDYVVDFYDAFR